MTSKFVLVHSEEGVEEAKARLAAATQVSLLSTAKRLTSQIGGALLNSFEAARDSGAIMSDIFRRSTTIASTTSIPQSTTTTRKASWILFPASKPDVLVTVGIWSLDAWLGSISELIEGLNQKQGTFVFYEVEASVPAGLISRPERVIPWLQEALENNPNEKTKRTLEKAKHTIHDNLIANDFFGLADRIRADLGLDYIVGVTPSMVAGKDEDGSYYTDHFSTYEGHTILASSYDLHAYASSSGLSFEAFLTTIVVSELLVAICPKLGFHSDTGCLFDYNDDRISLIDDVRDPKIQPDCMELIEPQYRDAALSLVDFIRSIRSTKP
jgi:hypothetical protein